MKTLWQTAIFVILASAGVVSAQVRPVQGGQALDANYLVGSRGLNSIRYSTDRIDTNLYVTGQVTGGFYFHGRQPYAGADQLRIDLPSAGMDSFIRGSVGIQQVLSGTSYGPSGYFSPSRTALSAGAIAEGMNVPGTSIPAATYLPAMSAKRLYDSAINAYKPVIPDVGHLLLYNPLIQPTLVGSPIQGVAGSPGQEFDSGAARPAASALFGILQKSDQQHLADELVEARLARQAGRIESRVEGQIQPEAGEAEPKKTDLPTGQAGETTTPGGKPPGGLPEPVLPQAPKPDEDVFVDMLLTMEKMRTEAEERSRRQGRPEDKERKEEVPSPADLENPDASGAAVPTTPTERTAVRNVKDKIVLARLAGRNRDLFNLNMSRAEKKLAEGEYYAAAEYYDVADVLNRGNPLAPLGASLALFAAGEPLSASFRLRQAMTRFPPLMETRVDVQLILDKNVVEMRIGQLEQRLADADKKNETPEPSLVFLAAFIRSSMNQSEKAAKQAETLAKIAGEEKLYSLYAEHLLKVGPAQTQPATPKGL